MDKKTFLSIAFFTVAFSMLGFGLLQMNLVPYGFTVFCVMPFLIGYTIGQYPKFRIILALSGVAGLVTFLYMLVIGGLETIFCVLTLLPLILLLMFVGIHIGYAPKGKEEGGGRKKGTKAECIYPAGPCPAGIGDPGAFFYR